MFCQRCGLNEHLTICENCLFVRCSKCFEKCSCGGTLAESGFVAGSLFVKAEKLLPYVSHLLPTLREWGLSRQIGKFVEVPVGLQKGFQVRDLREMVGAEVGSKIQLRPFQKAAVRRLLEEPHGFLVSPTGSGKTIMALAIIAELQQKTIFVCHTKQIANQTFEKARDLLSCKVGRWYGRFNENGDVVIALVQKITRHDGALPKHGLLLIDEVHHLAAPTFFNVVRRSKAAFKYGMTATLERRDLPAIAFEYALSHHVVKVDVEECLRDGLLAETIVLGVSTKLGEEMEKQFCEKNCPLENKPDRCQKCFLKEKRLFNFVESWVDNPERNALVARLVMSAVENDRNVLVLTRRISHAETLYSLLSVETEALIAHGKIPKKARQKAISRFSTDGGLLIATESLLGEGADFPNCDVLILASPSRGGVRGKQRAGRVMRGWKEKQAVIIDLIDNFDLGQKLWWSRRNAYEKLGLFTRRATVEEAERFIAENLRQKAKSKTNG